MMSASEKQRAYAELVAGRKRCELCRGVGLRNPSEVSDGELDSDHIGPYSRWHADLDAELMVVAKDFAPEVKFIEYGGAPGRKVQTNTRLARYLEGIGSAPKVQARVIRTGGSSSRTPFCACRRGRR